MSAFRNIQPAPGAPAPNPGSEAQREDSDQPPSPPDSGPGNGKGNKRLRTVTQACQDCRRHKAKCDGVRPRCGLCVVKDRPCGYEGEVGQSRQAALKARLESLERLFTALKEKPNNEVQGLLERIRTTDDIPMLFDQSDEQRPGLSRGDSGESGATAYSSSGSGSSSGGYGLRLTTGPYGHSVRHSGPSSAESLSRPPGLLHHSSQSRYSPASSDGGPVGGGDIPPRTALEVGRPVAAQSLWDIVHHILPSAAVIQKAVDSFFSCSGKLFHVFSSEQIDAYRDVAFDSSGHLVPSQKGAICCLCAVAAVGVSYLPEILEDLGIEEDIFYDVSKHYLENVIEEHPLDAIKVCALLGMYNIMGKATVSIAYVEIGLGMARRYGLDEKSPRLPGMSIDSWIDYRKAWRTLMFFSSWLCSTLGYMSGAENVGLSYAKVMSLVEIDMDSASDIVDIVQTEMTKISLLKADILRMNLAFKDLTALAIDSVMRDLQTWYSSLPPQMHLSSLESGGLDPSIRRSIYYVHLLYLGATMLVYRRIASQFVRAHGLERERDIAWMPFEKVLLHHAKYGVDAAKFSARILGLLLSENGIFKRCWLVIFQAHTSCVVALHSIVQKQLHNYPSSEWESDLRYVRPCLDTLSFCGSVDPVANMFRERLTAIYDRIAAYKPPSSARGHQAFSRSFDSDSSMADVPTHSFDEPAFAHAQTTGSASTAMDIDSAASAYLLTIPPNADPAHVELSLDLLKLLCTPFGDPAVKAAAEGNITTNWRTDPTRFEHMQMVERLDWKFESSMPFQWDMSKLGLGSRLGAENDFATVAAATAATTHRFLGSIEPNGWAGSSRSIRLQ